MKTVPEAQRLIADLSSSVWALAALSAAAESGALALLGEPRSAAELAQRTGAPAPLLAGLLDVVSALGLVQRDGEQYRATGGLAPLLSGPALSLLRADLQTTLLQSAGIARSAAEGALSMGWRHRDPALLHAMGTMSAGAAPMLRDLVFPQLPGLAERLAAPEASVLDVGTGVGAIAIALCGFLPQARVVALEPGEAPRAEAEQRIAAAGFTGRIDLRAQRIEDLPDREAFDFIWLPVVFLPREVLVPALAAAFAALRPGGWVVSATISLPGDDLQPALGRLRNLLWGGDVLLPDEAQRLFTNAGFADLRPMPGPPGGTLRPLAARRPL